MKITTQVEAIDLVKNGKIQISCRSKVEADKVCELIPDAINSFSITHCKTHLWNGEPIGNISFSTSTNLPTLSAKRFLALEREEAIKVDDCVMVYKWKAGMEHCTEALQVLAEISVPPKIGSIQEDICAKYKLLDVWFDKVKVETEADLWAEITYKIGVMNYTIMQLDGDYVIKRKIENSSN